MAFLPAQDDIRSDQASLLAQPVEDETLNTAARHLDLFLQTEVGSVELQRRLRATYADARSSIEETGVNILYLALGMLTWYEDANSEVPRQAPLLLIPVTLERKSVEQPFHIFWTGDEVGENLSLAMKLKTEFDVDYPEWPSDGEVNVEDYLQRIAAAVRPISRWRSLPIPWLSASSLSPSS